MADDLTPTHVALPIGQFEMLMKYVVSRPYSEAAPLVAMVNQTARNIQLAAPAESPVSEETRPVAASAEDDG